jgi:hypothetical protein
MGEAHGTQRGEEKLRGFWWVILRKRDHSEDTDRGFILSYFKGWNRRTLTEFIWLRIGTSGRLV